MTNFGIRMGAVVVAVGMSGCGLVDSNVTNFDLTLPDKEFTIDASVWQVDQMASMTYLQTSCASMPTLCASAAMQACGQDGCTGACNTTTQKCELSLEVSLYRPIDLITEKPELKSINDEPVIKVTLDSVTYDVPANTLNVATPVMTVYVAPMSVMEPSDPLAKPIGTIASVPAGTTVTTPQPIAFTATGKADLIGMMNNFKTPFNVIVGSTLVVAQGQPVPMGQLDAVVHIKAHAGL
jgi:hypothetical protein